MRTKLEKRNLILLGMVTFYIGIFGVIFRNNLEDVIGQLLSYILATLFFFGGMAVFTIAMRLQYLIDKKKLSRI
jgi:hypothetical protein